MCGAAGEGLEAHRTGPRVEVDDARIDDAVAEDVEERLAHQRGGGAHRAAAWCVDQPAAPFAGGDAGAGPDLGPQSRANTARYPFIASDSARCSARSGSRSSQSLAARLARSSLARS